MPGTPPLKLRRSGIHNPVGLETRRSPATLLAELQRLNHNGLLVMAEAATKRNGGGHEHGGGDNALQTLHGLLSFG